MLSHMDARERETWRRHGFTYVMGSDLRAYALTNGWKIFSLDHEGRPLVEYHFGPRMRFRYARGDRVLAQLMTLRLNADEVLVRGCRWRPARAPRALRHGTEYGEFLARHGRPLAAEPPSTPNNRLVMGLAMVGLTLVPLGILAGLIALATVL